MNVCMRAYVCVCTLAFGVGENKKVSLEKWPWIGSCRADGPNKYGDMLISMESKW